MRQSTTYPDLHALEYSLEFARAVGDQKAIQRLDMLRARSMAHGEGYGTHLPVLAAIAAITKGPILELGAGNFSTLLLNAMARAQQRKIYTLEADMAWLRTFEDIDLASDLHVFMHVTDGWNGWNSMIDSLPEQEWSIAFIDQTPGQTRLETLLHLQDRAEYLIVHDSCNSFFAGVDHALSEFKYQMTYSNMIAPTTVVSNKSPIPTL